MLPRRSLPFRCLLTKLTKSEVADIFPDDEVFIIPFNVNPTFTDTTLQYGWFGTTTQIEMPNMPSPFVRKGRPIAVEIIGSVFFRSKFFNNGTAGTASTVVPTHQRVVSLTDLPIGTATTNYNDVFPAAPGPMPPGVPGSDETVSNQLSTFDTEFPQLMWHHADVLVGANWTGGTIGTTGEKKDGSLYIDPEMAEALEREEASIGDREDRLGPGFSIASADPAGALGISRSALNYLTDIAGMWIGAYYAGGGKANLGALGLNAAQYAYRGIVNVLNGGYTPRHGANGSSKPEGPKRPSPASLRVDERLMMTFNEITYWRLLGNLNLKVRANSPLRRRRTDRAGGLRLPRHRRCRPADDLQQHCSRSPHQVVLQR